MTYKAYYYIRASGKAPLEDYFKKLRDDRALQEIAAALDRLISTQCNLPPSFIKHVWKKVFELRIEHCGNQYRIFYFIISQGKIILLTAYTKKTQKIPPKIMKQVQAYYYDYLTFLREKEYE